MRSFTAAFLTLALVVAPLATQSAGTDNTLTNLKGTLQYQNAAGAQTAVPLHGEYPSGNQGQAITGDQSLASFTFQDSSRVLIGMNTNVQLQSFSLADPTSASFVVVGKVRFTVQHPAGAKANYTFQTSTGQIAVRGTEGDISASPGDLQVNVYDVSNPALPVHVALDNGQNYDLSAGQSLHAVGVGPGIATSVSPVSEPIFQPFVEFGLPAHSKGLIGEGAPPNDAGTVEAVVGGLVLGGILVTDHSGSPSSQTTAQPTIAPTQTPIGGTTTVPINVTDHNQAPPAPSPQVIPPHHAGPP